MSEGIIAINPLMPYEDIKTDKITTPALGLGLGALGMGAYQSMKGDDKKEIQKVEEGSPQPEPPEDKGPNVAAEIATEVALKKGLDETGNQIKTWEVGPFKNIEEAKQAAKDNNITFEDLQRAGIRKQITFKKSKDILGYDVYFDKKLIGQIEDMTEELRTNNPDVLTNKKSYQLSTIDAYGNVGTDPYDTVDGLADAKWVISNDIAKSFIDYKDQDFSLSKIFPKIKYDKKGLPIQEKAMGGFIDKPLSGRSRDI